MGEFPNKATQLKSGDARSMEIQRKGAATKHINKSIAARIRLMKRRHKWSSKDEEWFIECFQNPEANVIKMLETLEEAARQGDVNKKDYLNFLERIHKLHYGDKIQIDKRTISLNLHLTDENKAELLEKFEELV